MHNNDTEVLPQFANNSKPSGNNQSAVRGDSTSITQGVQTVSVHTQDTICHLPVATQSVKDSVFTEQELQKIQNELRERYARSEIKGTRLDGNIQAWSVIGNHLVVQLCLNSPEARAVFREKIMDSPAIRFEGGTEPTPNNQRYTSDTLGIHLYPEFSAYPYTARTATFVLFNQSEHEIECGDSYHITYEDQRGVWRTLPIHTIFNCIAYVIQSGEQFLFKAAINLGMNVMVLDINQGAWKLETERGVIMDGDKPEHILEAIPVMGCYCDIIGVRSFARFEDRD